jgi:hypothetical protein
MTLSYNFNNIAKIIEYMGSFNLSSNDPLHPEIEITLQATLNLGMNEADFSGILIYPNPAAGVIKILYNDCSPIKARIYSVLGQKLIETTLIEGVNSINLQELPSGIYFINIASNSYKFIKQ